VSISFTTPNSTTLASNASYRPTSMPPPVPRIEPVSTSGVNKEELILLIQDLQNELATMVRTYSGDKERLKSAIITNEDYQTSQMNKSSTLGGAGSGIQQIASLKQTLNQALKQNAMLREKLQKIFREADTTDIPQVSILLIFSVANLLKICGS